MRKLKFYLMIIIMLFGLSLFAKDTDNTKKKNVKTKKTFIKVIKADKGNKG